MVRDSLKKLSGRTLNSSLSPDQSIAHGAAYYAGMLLTNQQYVRTVFSSEASTRLAKVRQQSVSARGLGILIRDVQSGKRVPHYLIPPNTPLPASKTHVFGTVVARQTKVHVRIVESGAGPGKPHTVLGDCFITDLPPDLPQDSEVEVTISYDHQARVHVTAREPRSGIRAEAEILRQENLSAQLQEEAARNVASAKAERPSTPPPLPEVRQTSAKTPMQQPAAAKRRPSPPPLRKSPPAPPKPKPEPEVERSLSEEWEIVSDRLFDFADFEAPKSEESEQPILLCNACGAPLNVRGRCPECGPLSGSPGSKASGNRGPGATKANRSGAAGAKRRPAKRSAKSPGVKRRRPDADDQHHN